MKITKRQLRRIIKEEKTNLLREYQDPDADDIVDGYYNAINQLIWDDWAAAGIDPGESPEEVVYAIQALKNPINNLESGQF